MTVILMTFVKNIINKQKTDGSEKLTEMGVAVCNTGN